MESDFANRLQNSRENALQFWVPRKAPKPTILVLKYIWSAWRSCHIHKLSEMKCSLVGNIFLLQKNRAPISTLRGEFLSPGLTLPKFPTPRDRLVFHLYNNNQLYHLPAPNIQFEYCWRQKRHVHILDMYFCIVFIRVPCSSYTSFFACRDLIIVVQLQIVNFACSVSLFAILQYGL
jgi:hypothetical protein